MLSLLVWLGLAGAQGLLPTAPPVHVHTSEEERTYLGVGYLQFGVTLPIWAKPGWTLAGDEDAKVQFGDARYRARGGGIAWGRFRRNLSKEFGVVGGVVGGDLVEPGFEYGGLQFSSSYERRGAFLAFRAALAGRIAGKDRLFLDIGFTALTGFYWFKGSTRLVSDQTVATSYGYNSYIDDYREKTFGLAIRPVLTLQPHLPIGKRIAIIPFVGGASFLAFSSNRWQVNEWYDSSYGSDCSPTCEGNTPTSHALFDGFGGFDIDFLLWGQDSLSLSSLFRAPTALNDQLVSEAYIVYGRGL